MRTWRRQRGEIPVGCFVGLLVLAVAVLIAVKTVPVMAKVAEFDKTITTMADRANRLDYPDSRIRQRLLDKADQLDLPITPEKIKIIRTQSRIKIEIIYDLEIEYPFYTYHWHKEHREERPVF